MLVLPGDTPLLRPETVAALVALHRRTEAARHRAHRPAGRPDRLRPDRPRGATTGSHRVVEHGDATADELDHRRGQHLDLLLPPQPAGPGPAPAEPRERPGRVLPDRRGRRCSTTPATGSRALVAGRPDRDPGRQRPGAAGHGRGRAAPAHQRPLVAPGRDHGRPRPHLHRRHRAARPRRHLVPRHDAAGPLRRSGPAPSSAPTPDWSTARSAPGPPWRHTIGRDAEVGEHAVVGPSPCLEPGSAVPSDTRTGAFYTATTDDADDLIAATSGPPPVGTSEREQRRMELVTKKRLYLVSGRRQPPPGRGDRRAPRRRAG